MHLKNAAAFKYQKKETFYDSFSAIRLTEQSVGELREIALSSRKTPTWRKGNEKFI